MSFCPLCNPNQIDRHAKIGGEVWEVDCKLSGKYQIDEESIFEIKKQDIPLHLIHGYIRFYNNVKKEKIKITIENLNNILLDPIIPKTFSEKINVLLLNLEAKSSYTGAQISLSKKTDYPYSFSESNAEFLYLMVGLNDSGYIKFQSDSGDETNCRLLFNGYQKIEKIKNTTIFSKQCFVAMAFAKERDSVFDNAISKAIFETGYSPYRIDRNEHIELIPFKMLEEIKKSKFIVSDCTLQKDGVYFEAGFAMGLGIPVIWLCDKNDEDNIHFDIKQYNHIMYSSEIDLYERLKTRINAIIN